MKFTKFLSTLFVHAVVWAGLLYGYHYLEEGIENLVVFLVGFSAMQVLIVSAINGGLRSFDVPSSRFGRVAFHLFQFSRLFMVFSLAGHGHFVSAAVLMILFLAHGAAYSQVRQFEKKLKSLFEAMHDMKGFPVPADFDAPVSETAGASAKASDEPKATTLEVKVNPNASRDPAFGYAFTNKDIAAST
jgi:hypothetical protein